jgi:hypothetical protein
VFGTRPAITETSLPNIAEGTFSLAVGKAMHDLDDLSGVNREDDASGQLAKGKLSLLMGMALGAGLGFLGGLLVGKRQGEALGLAMGLELGRTEALATLAAPSLWRRLWRREAAV